MMDELLFVAGVVTLICFSVAASFFLFGVIIKLFESD